MISETESFPKRLKRLREQKSLSIRDVASALDVSPSTYRAWEYGVQIKGEPYVALSKIYHVGLAELLTGEPSQLESQLKLIEGAVKSIRIQN